MLLVQKVSCRDIPLIRELTFKVWPQTYIPILGEVQVAYMLDMMYSEEQLKHQMNDGQQFLICYSNELPVAYASYSKHHDGYKLNKIYILPGQQRKGIGNFIINYIVNDIKLAGAIALYLNVNRYNYQAQAFYEKIGFEKVEEEDIDIGNGYFMNDYILKLSV